ncbi:MAG: DUF1007 family protein [Hyphomicrobiaceae bacterium]
MAISTNMRTLLRAGLALALATGATGPVQAHPHVWVSVETTVLFEGGSISGFAHKWTFDEFYTAMAIQDLDTNKDGRYSREELAELAKINIDGLKEFGYFTNANLGEARLALDAPRDYWLDHHDAPPDPEGAPKAEATPPKSDGSAQQAQKKDGLMSRMGALIFGGEKSGGTGKVEAPKVLTLHFKLPLKQPVLVDAPDFNFGVYDASFFIAFEWAKTKDAIKLGPGAPAGCRIDIKDAEKQAAEAQQLGEAFATQLGAQNFGAAAARTVKIACGPRS